MSIIHDALKKVQESSLAMTQKTPSNPFDDPAPKKSLTESNDNPDQQKLTAKAKIKSIFAITCTLLITVAITIASIEYIFQQFQSSIPRVQRIARNSFYTLIHRKDSLFKKSPLGSSPLIPLAQLTIKSNLSTPPITLNIHGIMSNNSGNLVLINDQVYQEGDTVDGAKIAKISLDSITVINNGVEQTIAVK